MKIVKIIVGILALIFALAHVVGIVIAVFGPRRYEGAFEISRYGGHIVGICVGGIIAALCFRSQKPKVK